MAETENLIDTLALERIEVNLFRGVAAADQEPRIFGGLVIGQALLAAYRTVEARICHSTTATSFPGDPSIPILYEVDRARDGRTFTTRRVTSSWSPDLQPRRVVQRPEAWSTGTRAQLPASRGPHRRDGQQLGGAHRDALGRGRNFENPTPGPPVQNVWMRVTTPLPDDIALQQAVLPCASRQRNAATSMRPRGLLAHARLPSRPASTTPSGSPVQLQRLAPLRAEEPLPASGRPQPSLGEIYNIDGRRRRRPRRADETQAVAPSRPSAVLPPRERPHPLLPARWGDPKGWEGLALRPTCPGASTMILIWLLSVCRRPSGRRREVSFRRPRR